MKYLGGLAQVGCVRQHYELNGRGRLKVITGSRTGYGRWCSTLPWNLLYAVVDFSRDRQNDIYEAAALGEGLTGACGDEEAVS